MFVGAAVVLVPLAFAALYLLLARADRPGASQAPGGVAYGVVVGVTGLLLGAGLVMYGLALLFIVVSAPGTVVFDASPQGLLALGLISLVLVLTGVLTFWVARQRLRQM